MKKLIFTSILLLTTIVAQAEKMSFSRMPEFDSDSANGAVIEEHRSYQSFMGLPPVVLRVSAGYTLSFLELKNSRTCTLAIRQPGSKYRHAEVRANVPEEKCFESYYQHVLSWQENGAPQLVKTDMSHLVTTGQLSPAQNRAYRLQIELLRNLFALSSEMRALFSKAQLSAISFNLIQNFTGDRLNDRNLRPDVQIAGGTMSLTIVVDSVGRTRLVTPERIVNALTTAVQIQNPRPLPYNPGIYRPEVRPFGM